MKYTAPCINMCAIAMSCMVRAAEGDGERPLSEEQRRKIDEERRKLEADRRSTETNGSRKRIGVARTASMRGSAAPIDW